MCFLTSRILSQKASSKKSQFCNKVCASSRLVSKVSGMARQKIKKKYLPDVSDSNQNVNTTCNSKLKFTELERFID